MTQSSPYVTVNARPYSGKKKDKFKKGSSKMYDNLKQSKGRNHEKVLKGMLSMGYKKKKSRN